MRASTLRTARLALSGCMLMLGLVLTVPAAAKTEQPPDLEAPISWLVIGDSYSAGEGVVGQRGPCAQAPRAYARVAQRLLAQRGPNWQRSSMTFLACTGAKAAPPPGDTKSVAHLPAQLDRVQGQRFDLITLTIGGNDAQFGPTIERCIKHVLLDGCIDEQKLDANIDSVEPVLASTYQRLKSEFLKPGGKIVVLGYPALFEAPQNWPAYRAACRFVGAEDVVVLRRVGVRLNALIERLTAQERIHFLSVAPGFEGHNLCPRAGQQAEWLNGLVRHRQDSSFHPKAIGHDYEGHLLAELLGRLVFPSEISKPLPNVKYACGQVKDPIHSDSMDWVIAPIAKVDCTEALAVFRKYLRVATTPEWRDGDVHVAGWTCLDYGQGITCDRGGSMAHPETQVVIQADPLGCGTELEPFDIRGCPGS